MNKLPLKSIFAGLLCSVLLVACDSGNTDDQDNIDSEVFDPNSSLNTIFDGKIFSIPSPVQTAYLIKQMNLEFDESLLNDDASAGSYVTEYQQALNLGIYGTDLGYSALYDQKSVTMKYLTSVEKLTSDLGLDAAFDTSFLTRFENNSGDEDSMILLMSEAFRQADNFLKQANRKSASALILTGGWIESVYFACQLNSKKPSPDIERRIGEQKNSLNSILEILTEYNKEGANDDLIERMKTLKVTFDKVEMIYEYAAPETDAKKNHSTFNHKMEIKIGKDVLEEIKNQIGEIRSNIIKA